MSWRRLLFDGLYRVGSPIWDIPIQPELRAVIEGDAALAPGRVVDLGCGTGTNVIYLARHGWHAVGVDFSAAAIRRATRNARSVTGAAFVEGDVTKLTEVGIGGPFDLALDYGCFHTLATETKLAYVPEVAGVLKSGAPLLMWEGIRMRPDEIPDLFSDHFVVERVEEKDFTVERFTRRLTVKGKWYCLRRR